MADLNRQQFCAELGISESTVRRLELDGLPFTPVGRGKRYDLAECKRWLRARQPKQPGDAKSASWSPGSEFIESYRRRHLRVMPSGSTPRVNEG